MQYAISRGYSCQEKGRHTKDAGSLPVSKGFSIIATGPDRVVLYLLVSIAPRVIALMYDTNR